MPVVAHWLSGTEAPLTFQFISDIPVTFFVWHNSNYDIRRDIPIVHAVIQSIVLNIQNRY